MTQVAIVTGAGRGIGRAVALRLADRGFDVALVGRDLSASYERYGEQAEAGTVQEEVERRGRRALSIEGDLREPEFCHEVADRTRADLGRIDVLVNNAGGALTPVERSWASQMPLGDLDDMIKLNANTAIMCCQAVVPVMREQGGGSIVNVGTRAALDPATKGGLLTPYALAKTVMMQYTRFLALEVGPAGIRVNCVSPGIVATGRVIAGAVARGIGTDADRDAIPMRRFATPEDIAGAVEFFASDLSAYVTGQVLPVDGGSVITAS
ncbi:SDR family NAD(P)-dependent oxidoreductase [Nocardioides seonyuensis]|nr:SDR family NAD(P)-dependent oxidoreductase [Nocardioides seonyuensis]